jgi:hypothetical protein
MHLQTLVAHGDLSVHEGRGIGQANVYSLTQKGLRTFHEGQNCDPDELRRPRRRPPTGSHFLHELLITEVAVSLTQTVRTRADLSLPWQERFGLIGTPAFKDLIPDYAFLLKQGPGLLACFVEVTSGEGSPTRIGQKLTEYATWSLNPVAHEFLTALYRSYGARDPRPHYRVVLVVQDRRSSNDRARIRQILWQTLSLSRTMRARIWLASVAELGSAKSIDDPIWTRARDLDEHLSEWETRPKREQRNRFRAAIGNLGRYQLFPGAESQT